MQQTGSEGTFTPQMVGVAFSSMEAILVLSGPIAKAFLLGGGSKEALIGGPPAKVPSVSTYIIDYNV